MQWLEEDILEKVWKVEVLGCWEADWDEPYNDSWHCFN